MSLTEMGLARGSVRLGDLFDGSFRPERIEQKLVPLADWICRGGWPALQQRASGSAAAFLDSYLDALFTVNVPRKRLNGEESRRVATSLARNMGNAVKLSTVAQDAQFTNMDDKSASAKAAAHIGALEELYVLERLEGWDAPVRARSRVRTRPKYYFADPSIAAALLQVTPDRLLADGQLFGVLFEAFCIHELLIYAGTLEQAQSEPLRYYRDSDGAEVDVILELRDGRWAGLEIKLGENKVDEAAAALHRLERKVAANPAARSPKPAFLAVIVGAGELARYDPRNEVYVLPITALTA